jgi:hypothetical protein
MPDAAGAPSKHLKDLGDVLQAAGAECGWLPSRISGPAGMSAPGRPRYGLAHIEHEPPLKAQAVEVWIAHLDSGPDLRKGPLVWCSFLATAAALSRL